MAHAVETCTFFPGGKLFHGITLVVRRSKKFMSKSKIPLLLSREDFERLVFARDGGVCLFCHKKAVDAHHILERKLFQNGGYFLDNGASVCSDHHMQVEMTQISCGRVRKVAGITQVALPEGWDSSRTYDKWGNVVVIVPAEAEDELVEESGDDDSVDKESTYPRRPGPMFDLPNVQKILKKGNMMWVFSLPIEDEHGSCTRNK